MLRNALERPQIAEYVDRSLVEDLTQLRQRLVAAIAERS